MIRRLLPLTLAALPLPLAAQTDPGPHFARGLGAAEAELMALTDPTASDLFFLGGVRFLSGIEAALQARYRAGIAPDLREIPILRLPIPENPAPDPFEPQMIADLFTEVLADMTAAAETLAEIEGEIRLTVNTDDIWFDIDGNGSRGPGEELAAIAGIGLGRDLPGVTITFDTADGEWLRAYSHLLSGVSELILAFDPAEAITRVNDGRAAMDALNQDLPPINIHDQQFGHWLDYAAMILTAVEVRPDATRTRAAREHFLTMVEANRNFWLLVAQETDNDAEWIPNKNQQSATGLTFPPDTGEVWLSVLAEAEAVLRGDALIPFWRLGEGAGIDLHALMEDPPEVNVIAMLQGMDLVPYMQTGRVMRWESLRSFMRMAGGDALLFIVMIN